MRGSGPEDGEHSTSDSGERPRPWLRVIASLALFGFLIGLMVGRLLQPDELRLAEVEALEGGLVLWFNEAPQVRAEHFQGAFVLRVECLGRERHGQLQLAGHQVSWRLQRERRELVLRLVAARPLRAEWRSEEVDGRWRLAIGLVEQ